MQIFVSPRQHFEEVVDAGLQKLKVKANPAVSNYLVELLEFFVDTRNLFPSEAPTEAGERRPQTFAEVWLTAQQSEPMARQALLKDLGDRTLCLSGLFADSLQRKIIDIDYYADLGGSAYAALADLQREDRQAFIFKTMSKQFLELADVLSFVAQKSFFQTDESVLRLYDKYLKTGSEVARDRLSELGIVALPSDQSRKAFQD